MFLESSKDYTGILGSVSTFVHFVNMANIVKGDIYSHADMGDFDNFVLRLRQVEMVTAAAAAGGLMYGGYKLVSKGISLLQGMKSSSRSMKYMQGICFTADTEIYTENGLIPIKDIKPGNMVWSFDDKTGDVALRSVIRLFRNTADKWVHIHTTDDIIETTLGHDFYIPGKGWLDAVELTTDDYLLTPDGSLVDIQKVEIVTQTETTYNFEVTDYHTYYVSQDMVLVHNQRCSSLNQIKEAIERGLPKKLRKIKRLDPGNPDLGELPHIHFEDGASLFIDGTWKHKSRALTRAEKEWLESVGWTIPD